MENWCIKSPIFKYHFQNCSANLNYMLLAAMLNLTGAFNFGFTGLLQTPLILKFLLNCMSEK